MRWGLAPAESAPILQGDKVLLLNRDKCEALAQALNEKPNVREARAPERHYPNPDQHLPGSFRACKQGGREIITHTQVAEAIKSITFRESPSPDGCP